jgi:hypothetical protein
MEILLSFKGAVGAPGKSFVTGYFILPRRMKLSNSPFLNGGFINLSSSSLYISRPILKSGTLKIDLKVASKFFNIFLLFFRF